MANEKLVFEAKVPYVPPQDLDIVVDQQAYNPHLVGDRNYRYTIPERLSLNSPTVLRLKKDLNVVQIINNAEAATKVPYVLPTKDDFAGLVLPENLEQALAFIAKLEAIIQNSFKTSGLLPTAK